MVQQRLHQPEVRRDHLVDCRSLEKPSNPIVPLSTIPHHSSQLDADFFDAISDALDYGDKRVADRTRFGHRNMADHNLDSVLSANWAGAFLHHKEIDKQVKA